MDYDTPTDISALALAPIAATDYATHSGSAGASPTPSLVALRAPAATAPSPEPAGLSAASDSHAERTATEPQVLVASPNDTHEEVLEVLPAPPLCFPPRRVKVYLLSGEDWHDNGTGYCTGEIHNEVPCFTVRNENNTAEVILTNTLTGSTQYQRQQETLVVWTDAFGNEIALSFQEPEGCNSLCDFLVEMHERYASGISLVQIMPGADGKDVTELIVGPMNYPPAEPSPANLEAVLEPVSQGSNSVYTREHMARFLIENGYVGKLVAVFEAAERERDLPSLHALCRILKTLTLYNETAVIELMIEDRVIMGVCGIFEYDPEFPTYKANHRAYLADESRYKEVVTLAEADASIRLLIRNNFRLQFLRDVILARLLDDATLTLMNHLIYFNQVEIVAFLRDSPYFLDLLFQLYTTPNPEATRREGVRMLHQFTMISKTLQPAQKTEFFRALVAKGLFQMLGFGFKDELAAIRIASVELLMAIISHNVLLVNTSEHNDGPDLSPDMGLISILCDLMINEPNQGLKIQAFEALKLLLDPMGETHEAMKGPMRTDAYFRAFYTTVAPKLFGPVTTPMACPSLTHAGRGTPHTQSLLLQQLCELIAFCTREHDKDICRRFFLDNDILIGVARLVGSSPRLQLRLAAIRCLKHLLFNDEAYAAHVVKHDLLAPVFALLRETAGRDNLANSTCLDLIEQVLNGLDRNLKAGFQEVAAYIVDKHRCVLEEITYVSNARELVSLVLAGTAGASGLSAASPVAIATPDDRLKRQREDEPELTAKVKITGAIKGIVALEK